jgi:hypothetical protein
MIVLLFFLLLLDFSMRKFVGIGVNSTLIVIGLLGFLLNCKNKDYFTINKNISIFLPSLFYSFMSLKIFAFLFAKKSFLLKTFIKFSYLYIFIALIWSIIFGYDGSKNIFGIKVFYSLGPEGDPNYSSAVILVTSLFLLIVNKISVKLFIFINIVSFFMFFSRGALLSFVIILISLRLTHGQRLFGMIMVFSLQIILIFILNIIDDDILLFLSQISSYRTDVWLYMMGLEPVLLTQELASQKQAHNALVQAWAFSFTSFIIYIVQIVVLTYLTWKSEVFLLVITLFLIGSTLNSFTSTYYLLTIIFIYTLYNKSYMKRSEKI